MNARQGAVGVALVVIAVLSGCSSTTSGTGSTGGIGGSTGGRSSADFPSEGPATSAPATAPTAQPTSAPPASNRSPAGSSTRPAPATPLRTSTVLGDHGTYVIREWARVVTPTCPDHAYGAPVIAYLTAHACSGLTRLLATTTVDGRQAGFAQSTLGFMGTAPEVYKTAGDFRALVTKDGTGNLRDLMRDGYRLPSGPTRVPYPNAFSALSQDNGVTVVEAWYLHGPTPDNDPALVAMAKDIFLQF